MNLDTNYEDEKLNKIVKNVIKNDQIQFTTNLKSISASEIILICINFDFNKNNYSENLKNLKKLFIKIGQVIKKNTLILVETTLPPGTCDNLLIPSITKSLRIRNMSISDIHFSYSFERVMPEKDITTLL